MFIENGAEQYRFSCRHCGGGWVDDYEVRHVTNLEGEILSFYGHGGFPCEAPAAADVVCQRCRCSPVDVVLLARRLVSASE